jgi:hypothetical protein
MTKRLLPGDVLEVPLAQGLGYLLYVGRHAEYGDAITVSPAVVNQRPSVTVGLFDEGYVTFYPARAALAQGLVTVVGRLPAPALPTVLRRAGVRTGRRVETWIIEDESGETMKRTLDGKERLIPIAAIWTHEFLIHRIAEGWRPEQEG